MKGAHGLPKYYNFLFRDPDLTKPVRLYKVISLLTTNGIKHSIHEEQGYEWKETYYIPFSRVLKRDLLKPKVKSQISGKLLEIMTYSTEDNFELVKEINTEKLRAWVRQNKAQISQLEKAIGISVRRKRVNFEYSTVNSH